MNFNYGEVLSKAWQIIWKFKILWVFGILASCSRGGGSSNGGGNNGGGGNGSNGNGFTLPSEVQRFFDNLQPWMIVVGIIVLVLFILLMIFIANYVGTIGRLGLVNGTVKGDQGASSLTFAELLQTRGPLFWRVFWLNLLAGLVVGIIFLIMLLPMIGLSILTLGIGLLCLIPFICLLVPISWVISIWLEQANISMIIEGSSIGDALRKAWDVMKRNAVVYLVMALILGVIGIVIGMIVFMPLFAVMIPAITGIALGTGQALGAGVIISLVCFAVLFPFLLVLGGITTAYTTSAWTLTYLRLTRLSPVVPVPAAAPPESF